MKRTHDPSFDFEGEWKGGKRCKGVWKYDDGSWFEGRSLQKENCGRDCGHVVTETGWNGEKEKHGRGCGHIVTEADSRASGKEGEWKGGKGCGHMVTDHGSRGRSLQKENCGRGCGDVVTETGSNGKKEKHGRACGHIVTETGLRASGRIINCGMAKAR